MLAEVTLAAAAEEEATLAAVEADTAVVEEVDMAAAVEEASAAVTRCPSLVLVSSNKHGVSLINRLFSEHQTNYRRHGHSSQI